MKTRLIISVVIISLATMWSCKKDAPEMRDIPLSVQQKNMVVSGNAFAFNLLQRTVAFEETPKNIMISPLSVHYALAMTANGARNNTLAQMLEAMDFAQYDIDAFNQYFKFLMGVLTSLDDKVDLSIANSIWYRNTFSVLPAFLEVNQQYYNAEVSALDFDSPQAVNTINDWVDNATRGKIDEIVEDIGPDMVMFLINAIYFYGEWKFEFDPASTSDRDFIKGDNQVVSVPTMQMEADLKYFAGADATVVELPYGRGNFVMNILLPSFNSNPQALVALLDLPTWTNWSDVMTERNVKLYLPKFSFEYEQTLNQMLIDLGMTDLFSAGIADLSGINVSGGLVVSEVKHKTFIDVDEKGTEAAAVTSVGVALTSVDPNGPVTMVVDRPFVFLIREKSTGAVLFSGVVENPLE